MNWSLFFDLTVSGLTLGSLYALIALGYSMVYGILKLLNFAHGDVYMIGAFLGWYALHALGGPVNPTFTGAAVLVIMFSDQAFLNAHLRDRLHGFRYDWGRRDRTRPGRGASDHAAMVLDLHA